MVDDDEPKATVEEQEISSWLSNIGDSSDRIKIEKMDEDGHWCYVSSRPRDSVSEDTLARWGPGLYWIKTIKQNGRYGPSKQVRIMGEPVQEIIQAGNGADSTVQFQLKMMEFQMKMAMDQSNKFHDLLLAVIATNKGDGNGNIGQIISAVKDLKELSGPAANPIEQLKSTAELIEIFRDGAGGPDRPATPMDLLMKFGPALLENTKRPALSPQAGAGSLPPATAQAPLLPQMTPAPDATIPVAAVAVPADGGAQQPLTGSATVAATVQPETLETLLLAKAQAKRPAEFWADYVMELGDQQDPEALMLIYIATKTDGQEMLAKLDAELKPWFQLLLRLIKDAYSETEETPA